MSTLSPEVKALFGAPNIAHVATLEPDGSPHSVPVWIGTRGDRVVFLTDPASHKGRNLERDPRVALSVVDGANPYATAYVRGRVVERVEGDEAWKIIDEIARAYTGQPYPLRSGRAVYVVEPHRAAAPSFG